MNQKYVAVILIVVGLGLFGLLFAVKAQQDAHLKVIVRELGSCYLEDGTCLHESRSPFFIIWGALSGALIVLGAYLIFFDRAQTMIAQHQATVASALEEARRHDREKDEFSAFLGGFPAEEQEILRAVKEQEGITQATLRYRTGMSKTGLSLALKSLEERDIVSRKTSGKTNEVYLRKKF